MHLRVVKQRDHAISVRPPKWCDDNVFVRSKAKEGIACFRIDFERVKLRVRHDGSSVKSGSIIVYLYNVRALKPIRCKIRDNNATLFTILTGPLG